MILLTVPVLYSPPCAGGPVLRCKSLVILSRSLLTQYHKLTVLALPQTRHDLVAFRISAASSLFLYEFTYGICQEAELNGLYFR
jgi:hypothetical protein